MELESQIEDLHSNQSALNNQEDSELKQKINSFIKKHKETDAELQSCSVTIESLESQVEASGQYSLSRFVYNRLIHYPFFIVLCLAFTKNEMIFFIVIKNQQLQECLNRKDEEIRVMEERYRMYLAKAKNVCMSFLFNFIVAL